MGSPRLDSTLADWAGRPAPITACACHWTWTCETQQTSPRDHSSLPTDSENVRHDIYLQRSFTLRQHTAWPENARNKSSFQFKQRPYRTPRLASNTGIELVERRSRAKRAGSRLETRLLRTRLAARRAAGCEEVGGVGSGAWWGRRCGCGCGTGSEGQPNPTQQSFSTTSRNSRQRAALLESSSSSPQTAAELVDSTHDEGAPSLAGVSVSGNESVVVGWGGGERKYTQTS